MGQSLCKGEKSAAVLQTHSPRTAASVQETFNEANCDGNRSSTKKGEGKGGGDEVVDDQLDISRLPVLLSLESRGQLFSLSALSVVLLASVPASVL